VPRRGAWDSDAEEIISVSCSKVGTGMPGSSGCCFPVVRDELDIMECGLVRTCEFFSFDFFLFLFALLG